MASYILNPVLPFYGPTNSAYSILRYVKILLANIIRILPFPRRQNWHFGIGNRISLIAEMKMLASIVACDIVRGDGGSYRNGFSLGNIQGHSSGQIIH